MASQYLLHADMTPTSSVVVLKILLWFQKCGVCVGSALNLLIYSSYCWSHVCVGTLTLPCAYPPQSGSRDKASGSTEQNCSVSKVSPGFPGIVLCSQWLTSVRIFQGRHYQAVTIILHAVFNVVGAQFLKNLDVNSWAGIFQKCSGLA